MIDCIGSIDDTVFAMSMLQQILDKMFVEPEILEALDEEQKQILFIKMREEQVKRWKAYEEEYERQNPVPKKRSDNSRGVQWLTGSDGEVWVWVMGEHKDDLSVEELIEKQELEQARQLAEREMLESIQLSAFDNDQLSDVYPSEDENTLKQQLSRMGVLSLNYPNRGFYDDSTIPGDYTEKYFKESLRAIGPAADIGVNGTGYYPSSYDYYGDALLNETIQRGRNNAGIDEISNDVIKNFDKHSSILERSGSGEINATAQPNAVLDMYNERSFKADQSQVTAKTIPYYSPASSNELQVTGAVEKIPFLKTKSSQVSSRPSTSMFALPSTSWATNKSTTLPGQLDNQAGDSNFVKMRQNLSKKSGPDTDELVKRQSEIFEMIKEKRQKILKEAEGEAERANREWEEQERKAREAEAQIRRIAQKAREQHRQQSLRTSTSILPALKDTNAASLREAIKNLPRPPKPKSRQAIVDWFRVEELSRGTGYDPKTNLPAPWFHGIISREKADELLKNKPSGSFLVRISERIWGYTVSYVVGDGTTKHFLIERIPEGYQFLGTNQVVHRHLFDLITYHETAPITMKGNEILKWAVGQVSSPPDYAELLLDSKTLKQRSNTLPSLLYRRI